MGWPLASLGLHLRRAEATCTKWRQPRRQSQASRALEVGLFFDKGFKRDERQDRKCPGASQAHRLPENGRAARAVDPWLRAFNRTK